MIVRCLFLLAMLVLPTLACAEDRLALLIGNSRYEHAAPLRNPENDVEVVARSLKEAGFRTTVVANLDLAAIEHAVDAFVAEALRHDRPTLLVYYAGHGLQRDGANFLLPVDFEPTDAAELSTSAYHVDTLLDKLSSTGAAFSFVILDACRDDPFDKLERGAISMAQGLSPIRQITSQLVAFSTAPGKTASDGNTGTSPYASAFAESVIIPGLRVREVFDRVREKVTERTRGAQEPWETSAIHEDFYFTKPDPSAKLSEFEQLYWDNAAMIDTAEKYQSYLTKYPEGRFAALARQKIDNINRDFAFRKEAETFPVVTATAGGVDFCHDYDGINKGVLSMVKLDDYEDQVLFLDVKLPLRDIICQGAGGWSGIQTSVAEGTDMPCDSILSLKGLGGPKRIPRLRCVKFEGNSDKSNALDRWGYLEIHDFEAGTLAFTAGEHPSYSMRYHPEEGDFNNAYVQVTGLARLRMGPYDEGHYRDLVPVDAAEIGMTWKYQNTLDAYAKGAEDSGLKTISLDFNQEEYEREKKEFEDSAMPITSTWMVAGSTVGLYAKGEQRLLAYHDPSPELLARGIDAGTELFVGESPNGRDFKGSTWTTSERCDSVEFRVSGSMSTDGKQIVLSGTAPTFDDKCRRRGTHEETMVFNLLESMMPEANYGDTMPKNGAGDYVPDVDGEE